MKRFLIVVPVIMAALAACGVAGAADQSNRAVSFDMITLRHAPTGLTIRVPEGFALQFRKGVYVLRKGGTSVSFSRLVTAATPSQVSDSLFKASGDASLVRQGDSRHSVGQVVNGKRGDTFVVERAGLAAGDHDEHVAGGAPSRSETLRQIGLGARGGVSLQAPESEASEVDPAPRLPRARRRRDRARSDRELEHPELRRHDHRASARARDRSCSATRSTYRSQLQGRRRRTSSSAPI